MSDYSELVKKLRDLHRDPRPTSYVWLFDNQVALYDAATAIEALLESVGMLDEQRSYWIDKAAEYYNQLPKRGHWIENTHTNGTTLGGYTIWHDYTCSVCGGIMGRKGDAYCYKCGAKMEVQDGSSR